MLGEMLMSNFKSILARFLFTICVLASSTAFAYAPAGTTIEGPGPSSISYAGMSVPCHLSWAFYIPYADSPTGSITNAEFSQQADDSSFCPQIVGNGLPWALGPATETTTPGIYIATISGVSITIPALHATCTGTLTITLNYNAHLTSITGTLHNGTVPCGFSANVEGGTLIIGS